MEQLSIEDKYIVKLDVFEGPLDLLLHLIRKHELDIFDIPISFITAKYLEYLELMKQLNLDLAAEYLETAAMLALIKSRMMLPKPPAGEDEEFEEGPDPREELVKRLLEYQKYKTAAMELALRPLLGRDTFPRGAQEEINGEKTIAPPSLFALMEAFQKLIKDIPIEHDHEVSVTRISVSARISQLIDLFVTRQRLTFEQLFEQGRTRSDLVVTFLALLEMVRLHLVRIHQADVHSEIHISATVSINEAEAIVAEQLAEE